MKNKPILESLSTGFFMVAATAVLLILGREYLEGYLSYFGMTMYMLDCDNKTILWASFGSIIHSFSYLTLGLVIWCVLVLGPVPWLKNRLPTKVKEALSRLFPIIAWISAWLILAMCAILASEGGKKDAASRLNNKGNITVFLRDRPPLTNVFFIRQTSDCYFLYEKDSGITRAVKKEDVKEITIQVDNKS